MLKVNSTEMCEDLMRHGVIPRKSLTCTFPDLKKDLIRHFVRGYFDGDGCITKEKVNDRWNINITGNESFLLSLHSILKENEIQTGVYKIKRSKAKALEAGSLKALTNLYEYLYKDATVYLERKFQKYNEYMKEKA